MASLSIKFSKFPGGGGGGGMPPDPPRWNAHAVFTAFGGSAPPSRQMFLHLCHALQLKIIDAEEMYVCINNYVTALLTL